jgi:hypothetical protein
MEWIKVSVDVEDNPKVVRLRRLLRDENAFIYLERIWRWLGRHEKQEGSLASLEAADIADIARWKGDPEELLEALVKAGLVDRGARGILEIHDWLEWHGSIFEARSKSAERVKRWRAKQKKARSAEEPDVTEEARREAPSMSIEAARSEASSAIEQLAKDLPPELLEEVRADVASATTAKELDVCLATAKRTATRLRFEKEHPEATPTPKARAVAGAAAS